MSSERFAASATQAFLDTLERMRSLAPRVGAQVLGQWRDEFLRRGWVQPDGHLTCVQVPFGDSLEEVEVDIDEEAGVFRYASPQWRSRLVERPLVEIALYSACMDRFLGDLGALIGIESRQLPLQSERIAEHLWHVGNMRIAGTHDFAPVFMGRLWTRASPDAVAQCLCDPVWPRGGVLFLPASATQRPFGAHVVRRIAEFIRVEHGSEHFDAEAFDRVLRGFATAAGVPEPIQFHRGNRLKLPHFAQSRELTDAQASIIKVMWGNEGSAPPLISWAEANRIANTGFQSFDDLFIDSARRDEVIEKVSRGKYRVRRNP